MPLKLMLELGDKVLVGDDCIVEVVGLGRRPQLSFAAPSDVKIVHVKADSSKQFLNRKRVAAGKRKGGSPRFDREDP